MSAPPKLQPDQACEQGQAVLYLSPLKGLQTPLDHVDCDVHLLLLDICQRDRDPVVLCRILGSKQVTKLVCLVLELSEVQVHCLVTIVAAHGNVDDSWDVAESRVARGLCTVCVAIGEAVLGGRHCGEGLRVLGRRDGYGVDDY